MLKEKIIYDAEPENFDELIEESVQNNAFEEVCSFKNFTLYEVNTDDFKEKECLTKEQINEYFPFFKPSSEKRYIMMDEDNLYHN